MEETSAFLKAEEQTVGRIALATFLCMLAPVPLLLVAGATTFIDPKLSPSAGSLIGLVPLLTVAGIAPLLFYSCRKYTARFDYLEIAYGVSGMVRQKKTKLPIPDWLWPVSQLPSSVPYLC